MTSQGAGVCNLRLVAAKATSDLRSCCILTGV